MDKAHAHTLYVSNNQQSKMIGYINYRNIFPIYVGQIMVIIVDAPRVVNDELMITIGLTDRFI